LHRDAVDLEADDAGGELRVSALRRLFDQRDLRRLFLRE